MSNGLRFRGKRALVTGATRGLGRTTAEWLARDGADVYVTGRGQDDVDRAIAELSEFGTSIKGSIADLEDISQARSLAESALATMGPFDILINNAGFSKPQPFLDVTDADWDAEMTVNARAPFVIGQVISRAMIEHQLQGRIVNISTVGVYAAHPQQMVYDMAKAAIITMTQNMAYELGSYGITANCVAPGAVADRPGFDMSQYNPDRIGEAVGRFGTADDIANAVCFFCQEESGWVTGQTLLVDGGLLTYIRLD